MGGKGIDGEEKEEEERVGFDGKEKVKEGNRR
jgi:hypothetical protein